MNAKGLVRLGAEELRGETEAEGARRLEEGVEELGEGGEVGNDEVAILPVSEIVF